jgi:citrate synthase
MAEKYYSQKSAELIEKLAVPASICSVIDSAQYKQYDVKRGLRDVSGKGVVCGLTEISEINSSKVVNGEDVPCLGELFYRGYNIKDIVKGFLEVKRFGFEETAYLLLFGEFPDKDRLKEFSKLINDLMQLPKNFARDLIMKAPCADMMNALGRGVLSLYPYDPQADDISAENVLRQVLCLLAQLPLIALYGYSAYRFSQGGSLIMHRPDKKLSIAENILRLMREDGQFTELEAQVLDCCLILHAEHGGGNNSTFTTHVVSSSGTDTYSTIAAALGSLKGPRHGGANIMVSKMFDDMKVNLKSRKDADVSDYLAKLLDKQAFDKKGLIYGMGHAVYSLSDPRADVMREFVEKLAKEQGLDDDYALYNQVERLAPAIIADKRKIYKGVSANVDFYSGLLYRILRIPNELYTPLFAIARMAGWGAHRLEELTNNGKIIRPGYQAVAPQREYKPIDRR